MLRSFPVSRPAWANVLSGLSGGQDWKSPVEIVASASLKFTRTPYARARGIQAGRFGRWADGVTAMRADPAAFAAYWRAPNPPGPDYCSTKGKGPLARQRKQPPWNGFIAILPNS